MRRYHPALVKHGFGYAQRTLLARLGTAATALALAGACAAPRSSLPAADQAALLRERRLQMELAFQVQQERRQRLADLSWPLRRDGADLCGDRVMAGFGFSFDSSGRYEPGERAAIQSALGVGPLPTITTVASGGPADHADIRPGDVLTHVGRYRLSEGEAGVEQGYRWLAEFASGRPPYPAVPVRFERNAEAHVQELVPDIVCEYPVVLVESDAINAYADGSAAYLTNGMIRFTENDEELQVVIAHELAHNLEGHLTDRQQNMAVGGLLGLAADILLARATGVNTGGVLTAAGLSAGAQAYSQDFEREADYVGMYLLARAGVDTAEAARFWRRMAVEHTGSIKNDHRSTHPSTPERFVRLDATHEEITAKLAEGLPLFPNRKDEPEDGS